MNETHALPPPDEPAPTPPPRHWGSLLPFLYLLGFLPLAAGLLWLWQRPPAAPLRPAADPAELTQLRAQVQGLEQGLQRLAQRPDAQPPDLGPLNNRIAALEQRPGLPGDLATRNDLAGMASHADIAGLASQADLAGLSSRLDALAGRQDQLASREQGLEATLGNRIDELSGKLAALEKQMTAAAALAGQVDQDAKRLDVVESQAGQVAALADKSGRIARIQAAEAALNSGQPLGDLPDAPAPLVRFLHDPPPTEAELRLTFPAVADAAAAASRPSTNGLPFFDRVWMRAQDLVNLRDGDRVILGDPASGVIARARHALDAGDLAGAVGALAALSGPSAEEVAPWRARAQSLLDARAALAALAAHS